MRRHRLALETRHPPTLPGSCYQNGIGYGKWTHIDGWSQSVVEYIRELESKEA